MLKLSNKSMPLNKMLTMSAASLLLASQASLAAENTVMTDQGAFEFNAVDVDSDSQIGWNELSHPYGDQLTAAGWDQQQVLNNFDKNSDDQLSKEEYQAFTSSLNQQVAGQGLATNQSEGLGASIPNDEGWFEFDDVEANNDGSLGWNELDDAYGNRISAAGWDENQVMNEYDRNGNSAIDRAEYVLLVGGLQDAQQSGQMAGAQDSQRNQAQNRQSNNQAQAASSNQQSAPVAVITVLTAEETPSQITLSDLEDRQVVNLDGEQIGEVEDVVRSVVASDTGLVVSVGGFWDIGDKHRYFALEQFRLQGDKLVLQTHLGEDAIARADQFGYDQDNYTSMVEEYQASAM